MRWGRGLLWQGRGGKEGFFYGSKCSEETVVFFAGEVSIRTISSVSVTTAVVLRVLCGIITVY